MKRGLIFAVLALFLSLSLVSALPDLDIVKRPVNNIVIRELSNPATYDLIIKNNGNGDFFKIDTLLDVMIYPKDAVLIQGGEEKTLRINIYPKESERMRYYGDWSFKYYFKGDSLGIQEDNIMIKLLNLNDVLGIEVPTSVNSKDELFSIKVKNKENYTFDSVLMTVDSTLMSDVSNFTLSPLETKDVKIVLDPSKISREAGNYNLKITLLVNNEAELKFVRDLILESEVKITSSADTESSTFIEKIILSKKNDGNTPTDVVILANRTMLQSLLTSFSIKPDSMSKENGLYVYKWERKLNPGESFSAELKTNYAWPWIILLIVLACYIVVRILTTKQIMVRKKAVRVKTKGGQFAAKVILFVKNKGKDISNAKIIETIPPFTELLQDRFGTIKPSEVRKHSIIWDLPFIAKHEELILSYIVYSRVSVLGQLEVAPAIATYQTAKGVMHESKSNSIFILTEEKKPETQSELIK